MHAAAQITLLIVIAEKQKTKDAIQMPAKITLKRVSCHINGTPHSSVREWIPQISHDLSLQVIQTCV